LAEAAVRYADARIADETPATPVGFSDLKRPKPGEFVADELSLLLRDQPHQVRILLARTRSLATGLPTSGKPSTVWRNVDADRSG
jgi:hypothetical protein